MTDPKNARLAFALLKIRQGQITRAISKVQPFLDQEPGDRNAAKIGQATLGKISMTEPEAKPLVVDDDLFTRYVQDYRPDQIVPSVHPSFVAALTEHMAKTGELTDWDGNEVPGVAFGVVKAPYTFFKAADGAEELLAVVEPGDLPVIDGVDLAAVLGLAGPATEPGEVAGDAAPE